MRQNPLDGFVVPFTSTEILNSSPIQFCRNSVYRLAILDQHAKDVAYYGHFFSGAGNQNNSIRCRRFDPD
jgi:hypothetical protein